MIKCNKELLIIDFLNMLHPSEEEIHVHICDGCDCIETPDGSRGFGVFIPSQLQIYIAEDLPNKDYTMPHTIAHEYRHFIQYINGKPFDEDDAEWFADSLMRGFQMYERRAKGNAADWKESFLRKFLRSEV